MKLLEKVSIKVHLENSWDKIKINRKTSPGNDGIHVYEFERNEKKNLKLISNQLLSKTYKVDEPRKKRIPKNKFADTGEYRTINIYNIKDKIIQRSIHKEIKEFFPETINEISIGFVENGGVRKAVEKVREFYKKGYLWLTTVDIVDFFESININNLEKIIYKKLGKDKSLNWLINQCLSVIKNEINVEDKIYTDEEDIETGVPQGSVLAPFFSNVYMSSFDKTLVKNSIHAIRYADDIAILSKTKDEAIMNLAVVKGLLEKKFGLKIHGEKTKKRPKHYQLRNEAIFLGLSIKASDKKPWDISPEKKRIEENKLAIKILMNRDNLPLYKRFEKINARIIGWYTTYHFVGCNNYILIKTYSDVRDILENELSRVLVAKKFITHKISRKQAQFIGILKIEQIMEILSKKN